MSSTGGSRSCIRASSGRDRVPGPGGPGEAKRYALGGELPRELWYDLDCGLVRAAWRARDGSRLVLESR